MPQEEADRIIGRCKLSDSTFFLGPNNVLDVRKIGQLLHVTQWHPSLLGQLRLLDDVLRITGQLGGDFYMSDIPQTAGAGSGRSSVGQTLRIDLNPWDALSFKFEASAHEHVTRGDSYATFGATLDFGLPLSLVVSPGWRSSVYNGVTENAGFLNIGLSEANQQELYPLLEYLRTRTGVPGTTQTIDPNSPPASPSPSAPPAPASEPGTTNSRWR